MKRHFLVILLGVFVGALSGCGSTEDISSDNSSAIEEVAETDNSTDMPSDNSENPQKDNTTSRMIEEQTFQVTLDGWGEVTFASYMPEDNNYGGGDVEFKLLQNDEVIYSFPGYNDSNTLSLSGEKFCEVKAVAFEDFDKDGKKDAIIINHYESKTDNNNGYDLVRLYKQEENNIDFVIPEDALPMVEYLQKHQYNASIPSVMEGIEKYRIQKADVKKKDEQEQIKEPSYYGTWEITSCAGTAEAYALEEDEIKEYIGAKIEYAEKAYAYNGYIVDNEQQAYKEEHYLVEDMRTHYRVEPSEFGITEDEILSVTIMVEGEFIGNYFWVLDQDKILIYYMGVFFYAERVQE